MGQDVSVPVGNTAPWASTWPSRITDARGAVMVLQEAFGVNDHIRDICPPIRCRRVRGSRAAPVPSQWRPRARIRRHARGDAIHHAAAGRQARGRPRCHVRLLAGNGVPGRTGRSHRLLHGWQHLLRRRCYWGLGAAVSFYGGGIAQSRFGLPRSSISLPRCKRHGWACSATSTVRSR